MHSGGLLCGLFVDRFEAFEWGVVQSQIPFHGCCRSIVVWWFHLVWQFIHQLLGDGTFIPRFWKRDPPRFGVLYCCWYLQQWRPVVGRDVWFPPYVKLLIVYPRSCVTWVVKAVLFAKGSVWSQSGWIRLCPCFCP